MSYEKVRWAGGIDLGFWGGGRIEGYWRVRESKRGTWVCDEGGTGGGRDKEGGRDRHCWMRDFWDSLTMNCCSSCLSAAESLEKSSCCCPRPEEASMLVDLYNRTVTISRGLKRR